MNKVSKTGKKTLVGLVGRRGVKLQRHESQHEGTESLRKKS